LFDKLELGQRLGINLKQGIVMTTLTIDPTNWQGLDYSIEISLYEYGIIWRQLPSGDCEFIMQVNYRKHGTKYGRVTLDQSDLDFANIEGIESFIGQDWEDIDLPHKVEAVYSYHNPLNLMLRPQIDNIEFE
jgi:hypothetical protein